MLWRLCWRWLVGWWRGEGERGGWEWIKYAMAMGWRVINCSERILGLE